VFIYSVYCFLTRGVIFSQYIDTRGRMRIKMANSEMNSDVLSCCSDYEDSFIHDMFNVTTQKLDSSSDK